MPGKKKPVTTPRKKAGTSTQRSRDTREVEYELRDLYIEYMGDVNDGRSLQVFMLETPGLTREMITKWSKMPSVKAAIRSRMDESVLDAKPVALKAMMRDMQGGKAPAQAAKTFLEVTGQFVPQSKQKVEVGKHDDLNSMTEEELLAEAGKTAEEMKDDGTNWRDEAKVIRGGGDDA